MTGGSVRSSASPNPSISIVIIWWAIMVMALVAMAFGAGRSWAVFVIPGALLAFAARLVAQRRVLDPPALGALQGAENE